jgi:signal transduction histidine kinase
MFIAKNRPGRLGLRGRVIVSFAVGAGLITLIVAVSVFVVSRSYLLGQRERSAERQALTHAVFVRNSLDSGLTYPGSLLSALETPVDTYLLLWWDNQWFSSSAGISPTELPADVRDATVEGNLDSTTTTHVTLRGQPYLAIAIPLNQDGATLFELAPLLELQATLRILGVVLGAGAAAAVCGGAIVGFWASRRVLTPLHQLGTTTAQIASGNLEIRLPPTGDRELVTIVDSFNVMVDSLQKRIERERRFFADVSHELRTPLTTLIASVGVLGRHADDMSGRSKQALALITAEVDHLRGLLDDLLALARIDAGLHQDPLEQVSLQELLATTLAASNRPDSLLTVTADTTITCRKKALERAFVNLMDNADRHGDGLQQITLTTEANTAFIYFDDHGPGVPEEDRRRIFERFATGHATRNAASGTGTGLGLALVAETISAHYGDVLCTDNPHGGARFVVALPTTQDVDNCD